MSTSVGNVGSLFSPLTSCLGLRVESNASPLVERKMAIAGVVAESFAKADRKVCICEPSADYEAKYAAAGDFFKAQPGSLEHWLTARYCLYSANRRSCIFRGEIDHPPWTLAAATYDERTNTMGSPFGFNFAGETHLLLAKPVDVKAWLTSRCEMQVM